MSPVNTQRCSCYLPPQFRCHKSMSNLRCHRSMCKAHFRCRKSMCSRRYHSLRYFRRCTDWHRIPQVGSEVRRKSRRSCLSDPALGMCRRGIFRSCAAWYPPWDAGQCAIALLTFGRFRAMLQRHGAGQTPRLLDPLRAGCGGLLMSWGGLNAALRWCTSFPSSLILIYTDKTNECGAFRLRGLVC